MNREQKLNRVERVRGYVNPTADKLAKDKTPKVQRVGNYYVKIKQGSRNQFVNVVPYYKLYKRAEPNLFAAYWAMLKSKFGI